LLLSINFGIINSNISLLCIHHSSFHLLFPSNLAHHMGFYSLSFHIAAILFSFVYVGI